MAKCIFLTCVFKVLECDLINREETNSGVVLGAHVGDGGPVRGRQLTNPGTKELHKFSGDARLAEVLKRYMYIYYIVVLSKN